ncbi:MAG: hypothetical protein KY476_08570 [Planctomycetes bacterium]|nr:hypothetical protein [Planctomycetota bacterium]
MDSWLTSLIGRSLGYDDVTAIESWRLSFGSGWAHGAPGLVYAGLVGLIVLSVVFYRRYQRRGRRAARIALAGGRAILLCLLFLILADPVLELKLTSNPKPVFWVLVDGTDSMAIEDKLPEDERRRFADAVALGNYLASRDSKLTASANGNGLAANGNGHGEEQRPHASVPSSGSAPPPAVSRMDYVRAIAARETGNPFQKLSEKFRLKTFVLDRKDGVRAVEADDDGRFEPQAFQKALTTDGDVTALGAGLEDLLLRHGAGNVAGMLVISDFDQNTGPTPTAAARKLAQAGVKLFTVGLGPASARDLAVKNLDAPLKMKKAEQSTLTITLAHDELDDRPVTVRLIALPAGADSAASNEPVLLGEKDVTLAERSTSVEFPFTPEETGRWVFTAEAGEKTSTLDERGLARIVPLEGEVVGQNNAADREVTIIDDFMRLLYVEYEPTWEWRFVKEVFHRDPLVGLRGFRTYLRSSDPVVRERNELFTNSLVLPRKEFFQTDVIFLGDMPSSALSTRFCELVKEFVGEFGGGLVVIAGPRFGPGQLAATPLADMLPVRVDSDARIRDEREFRLELTAFGRSGGQFDFMQLGTSPEDALEGWNNLGRLPWYQPVKAVEPGVTTVLAEHPTDVTSDGRTKQPLIAIRKYGKGEVVYIAFDELWRLRRAHGEKYYRAFWGPLIKRLGLSHALGSQKRFVVRTDRKEYRADDKVLLSVEAYDEDFEKLTETDVDGKSIEATVIRPRRSVEGHTETTLAVSQLKPGVFETRIPVFEPGEYRVRVTDPVTKDTSEVHFQVASVSAERRSAVRNVALEESLAAETGGRTYSLETVSKLPEDFSPPRLVERSTDIFPIWSTWPFFVVVIGLMLGEWFWRKMVNLA